MPAGAGSPHLGPEEREQAASHAPLRRAGHSRGVARGRGIRIAPAAGRAVVVGSGGRTVDGLFLPQPRAASGLPPRSALAARGGELRLLRRLRHRGSRQAAAVHRDDADGDAAGVVSAEVEVRRHPAEDVGDRAHRQYRGNARFRLASLDARTCSVRRSVRRCRPLPPSPSSDRSSRRTSRRCWPDG